MRYRLARARTAAPLSAEALALFGLLFCVGPTRATTIVDPADDFLSSYTGPQNGDMDVLTASAAIDGSALHLGATLNGPLGTTAGAIYVFGIDRGTNNAPFGAFRPGVLFDEVVIASAGGTGTVRDLVSGAATALPGGAIGMTGSHLTVDVPVSLLPSEGFAPSAYLVNLWPRTGLASNAQISDFAPDNSDFQVSSVPEPSSLAVLALSLFALGIAATRRV